MKEIVRRGLGSNFITWSKTGTGIFSGFVTLLAATLSVLFLLVPSIKPSTSGTEFSATLSDASIETDVVLAGYFQRLGAVEPASFATTNTKQLGVVFSYTALIKGFQGKECRVTWSLFDAATNTRATEDWLVSQPGWPVGVFVPEANVDQGNGEVFVPYPPDAGSYFVRLELSNPDGARLTTLDSPVFEVATKSDLPAPVGA